jgi:hypothetical protein
MIGFAHHGWCDTGQIAIDHSVFLEFHFGLDINEIIRAFEAGLHPRDVYDMIAVESDLESWLVAFETEDESLPEWVADIVKEKGEFN